MPDFAVHFDGEPFAALDRLALLGRQDYNLGNAGDWFGRFRGGLYGFYARLYGVQRHYSEVHEWLPRLRTPSETEYHLASIFFQMDSALECFTFALNALGWATMPSGFRNVMDAGELRCISPLDVLGNPTRTPPVPPKLGYTSMFPSFQTLWQSHVKLISQIRNLHDVSKHRQTIYVGGQRRLDAPPSFYQSLGIPEQSNDREDSTLRTLLCPDAEIILKPEPKSPSIQRSAQPINRRDLLENLVPSFRQFINTSGQSALADARVQLHLKEGSFRGGLTPEVRGLGD